MAKFLQATLKGGVEDEDEASETAVNVDDFISFLQQAQTSGKPVKNEDILKYSALFENEITLDNLSRFQLIALCQLLELQPMGTNMFLRFQIRMQLRSLKADDRLAVLPGFVAHFCRLGCLLKFLFLSKCLLICLSVCLCRLNRVTVAVLLLLFSSSSCPYFCSFIIPLLLLQSSSPPVCFSLLSHPIFVSTKSHFDETISLAGLVS